MSALPPTPEEEAPHGAASTGQLRISGRGSCATPTPAKSLIRCGFDGVRPRYLDCLITLRRKVLKGCRVLVCLRLLQAIPLGDGHTLGRCPLECNDPPPDRSEGATTGSLLRSLDNRAIRDLGCSIDHFQLCDNVGLRLCLSMKGLDRSGTNANTSDHCQCHRGVCF